MTLKNTHKNLLLYEDDEASAEMVQHIFETKGYNVCVKYEVDSYVKDIAEHHPHVILLDLRIPSLGGEIVCKYIKMAYDIPIVLYSADFDLEKIAKRANADTFVKKPFSINELYNAVESQYQKVVNEEDAKYIPGRKKI